MKAFLPGTIVSGVRDPRRTQRSARDKPQPSHRPRACKRARGRFSCKLPQRADRAGERNTRHQGFLPDGAQGSETGRATTRVPSRPRPGRRHCRKPLPSQRGPAVPFQRKESGTSCSSRSLLLHKPTPSPEQYAQVGRGHSTHASERCGIGTSPVPQLPPPIGLTHGLNAHESLLIHFLGQTQNNLHPRPIYLECRGTTWPGHDIPVTRSAALPPEVPMPAVPHRHAITPTARPQRVNAVTARSTCSGVCSALSCTRMRASPRGTTGNEKLVT